MLNGTVEREKGQYQGAASARIGLVGPPRSGATGLVWSLMVNSGGQISSPFGEGWRFDHLAPAKPTEDDLLLYLNPYPDQGHVHQPPKELGHTISDFMVSAPQDGWGARNGSSDRQSTLVKIFDTSTRRGRGESDEPGWVTHAYDSAPHIVLCHPMNSEALQPYWDGEGFDYNKLFGRLLRRCRSEASSRSKTSLQSLVIAFTRYDLAFVENPDQALGRAPNPADAREQLSEELQKCPALREGLRELSKFRKLRIVGIPVSTYGFTRDGRPNYDGWLRSQERDAAAAMLTRPDIYCASLADMHRDGDAGYRRGDSAAPSSKAQMDWLLQHWRPFMSADPFITCLSKDSHELIFTLADLLEEIPGRRTAYV